MGQDVCGAQCTGAGGQWGPTLRGMRSLGQNPWGSVHWGRWVVGHSALGQEVSGARRCGTQRHWGKISGAEGHGARRSGAGRRPPFWLYQQAFECS